MDQICLCVAYSAKLLGDLRARRSDHYQLQFVQMGKTGVDDAYLTEDLLPDEQLLFSLPDCVEQTLVALPCHKVVARAIKAQMGLCDWEGGRVAESTDSSQTACLERAVVPCAHSGHGVGLHRLLP
jgi:hypothetical protein